MRPHLAVAIVQIFTLRLRVQSYGAKVALGLAMLTPLVSAAQIKPRAVVIVAADTVAIWTNTMRVGTLAARDTALAKLAALPVAALPAETQRVLVAELNRVHLALQTGTAVGASEESEERFTDYYTTLVLVVTAFDTRESALALLPAVAVSGGVPRQIAQLGDTAVALLMQQLRSATQPDEHVSVFESLGLAWFWADSTGSPLSDRSRTQIVSALNVSVLSGAVADMGGVSLALLAIQDPAFLPLAQRAHDFAATQGVNGRYMVVTMEQRVVPSLTALAASRSTASLASGLARLVTAVCGTDATGRRHGTCQSLTNEIAAASQHLARGQSTHARNGFESVGKTIATAFADGLLSDAEHALLAGNVAMVLQRLAP